MKCQWLQPTLIFAPGGWASTSVGRSRRWEENIESGQGLGLLMLMSELNNRIMIADVIMKNVYFQLLRMAIHQKLVLTQRLEDIEMTDLRPANVIITTIVVLVITLTTPPSPSPSSSPFPEWSSPWWAENIRVHQQRKQQGIFKFPGKIWIIEYFLLQKVL